MFKRLIKSMRTRAIKRLEASDYKRWRNVKNLSSKWESRTLQIAKLIPPEVSVIEFGAGRMTLKQNLPPGCSYTPSDIVDRGGGTFVCDLNGNTLPDFPPHAMAVFSGVLEYVHDVPHLIAHLSANIPTIIASYAIADTNPRNRRANGWVNDYTAEQFVAIFMKRGYHLAFSEKWHSQMISLLSG